MFTRQAAASNPITPLAVSPPPRAESPLTAISPPARRWAELWKEIEFTQAKLLGQASHVRADRSGPDMEFIPQLFDLGRGRRFITIGVKYDVGPGKRRATGSVGMGQFLNLAVSDWEVAAKIWERLQKGDMGISFKDLAVIDGNFDQATKAADQYEKDRWIQKVWELKSNMEKGAKENTLEARSRIAREIESRPAANTALVGDGVIMPASVMEPDEAREAMTRFRINQGMYGDHPYFIYRPVDGQMTVHGISSVRVFKRASELQRDLSENWLDKLGTTLDDLIALTAGKDGAAFARAIEGAEVTRHLNSIVGTFWTMWRDPRFSANADFEVVNDHERRAEKYMDIMIQRTLRSLLKEAVEEIGTYPYVKIDRQNYRKKVLDLKEGLDRTKHVLQLFAQVRSAGDFDGVKKEKDRLVRDFTDRVRGGGGSQDTVTASA